MRSLEFTAMQIDSFAVQHYKHRLELLVNKKENIEIKPILEKQLENKFELLNEIIDCHETNNEKQRGEQWNRYQIPICKSLLLYKEDLEKTINIISEFGSEITKLNVRNSKAFLERIEIRLNSFQDIITHLERFPNSSSF